MTYITQTAKKAQLTVMTFFFFIKLTVNFVFTCFH